MAQPVVKEEYIETDFIHSDTAIAEHIDNAVKDASIRTNLQTLHNLLWTISQILHITISMNCAYRCTELNNKVGGVPSSEHRLGKAADCVPQGMTISQFFEALKQIAKDGNTTFGQVISEKGRWVHISTTGPHKNEFMTTTDGKHYVHV